jgi:hypothetical protein
MCAMSDDDFLSELTTPDAPPAPPNTRYLVCGEYKDSKQLDEAYGHRTHFDLIGSWPIMFYDESNNPMPLTPADVADLARFNLTEADFWLLESSGGLNAL